MKASPLKQYLMMKGKHHKDVCEFWVELMNETGGKIIGMLLKEGIKRMEELEPFLLPNQIKSTSICLNQQTVGNLKQYLDRFPDKARVVIHTTDRNDDYYDADCKIACNFDNQMATNKAVLLIGMPEAMIWQD